MKIGSIFFIICLGVENLISDMKRLLSIRYVRCGDRLSVLVDNNLLVTIYSPNSAIRVNDKYGCSKYEWEKSLNTAFFHLSIYIDNRRLSPMMVIGDGSDVARFRIVGFVYTIYISKHLKLSDCQSNGSAINLDYELHPE